MAAKMLVVILVFTLGGLKLDEITPFKFPLFTLIGSLAGAILAIYSVIRDLLK